MSTGNLGGGGGGGARPLFTVKKSPLFGENALCQAKSRDSYRRIASETYRCDSNR